MRTALATLSATLLAVALLAGCDKRSETATGTTPVTPPASAASQ